MHALSVHGQMFSTFLSIFYLMDLVNQQVDQCNHDVFCQTSLAQLLHLKYLAKPWEMMYPLVHLHLHLGLMSYA